MCCRGAVLGSVDDPTAVPSLKEEGHQRDHQQKPNCRARAQSDEEASHDHSSEGFESNSNTGRKAGPTTFVVACV
jgi:hypothetical protein